MVLLRAAAVAVAAIALAKVGTAQVTTRDSVDSSGAQASFGGEFPWISADGGIVGFQSLSDDLVPGDTNGFYDIFVHDRSNGATERVSVDSMGKQSNDHSAEPRPSADGTVVAFSSHASNLVAGDSNGTYDVFVHDRTTGVTERVSVDSAGGQANAGSGFPSISADGRFVAFTSSATNLVANDTNGIDDIFVHDRSTGTTERVSVDSSGVQADARCFKGWISADGQFVAFDSKADNLVPSDTNQTNDAFVHDRSTGATERVSLDSSGAEGNDWSGNPTITTGGSFVVFVSHASNLVANDGNGKFDTFVRDRATGTTECVSVDASGAFGNNDSGSFDGSQYPSISDDGRIVVFESFASNLASNDNKSSEDAFLRDRSLGITEVISVDPTGAAGNQQSGGPAVSADGQFISFWSEASNLVAGDTNKSFDAFVRARQLASWTNYGSGFPGTSGVPSFTSRTDPLLGTTVTLDLANSYGLPTAGLIFLGDQRASIHSAWGGDLLVLPMLVIPIAFSSGPNSYTDSLPDDDALCGSVFDLQAVEADPGAVRGVSFTAGLELVLGR